MDQAGVCLGCETRNLPSVRGDTSRNNKIDPPPRAHTKPRSLGSGPARAGAASAKLIQNTRGIAFFLGFQIGLA